MSDTTTSPKKPAPGFFWFLVAFLGFAVGANLLTRLGGERPNPRDGERAAAAAEIKSLHAENLTKMGLAVGSSTERLAKGVGELKALPAAAKSSVVVPGSPTQLQQAPAAPATPPAAAPAPAPATPSPASN
jgi:hypothetical protein